MDLAIHQIIDFFIQRWTVEVTFEEIRAHLGVETQRQWSDLAIARTTPVLMALFSLVTLWTDQLYKRDLVKIKPCAWYKKPYLTFSDAIAAVRMQIWRENYFSTSRFKDDIDNLNADFFNILVHIATRAA